MQPDFSQIGPYLFAALVVFAVYRRLRRSFGRQLLRPTRVTLRIVVLALIGCAMLPMALLSAQYLAAELAGASLGVALALWGAQRTRFATYEGQLHYVPHTYTGIAVSLLFLGRLTFRIVQMYTGVQGPLVANAHVANAADPSHGFAPASMVSSPFTVATFFVLIGYYVCYYSWVLWKSKHLQPEDIEVSAAPTQ